jgi:hypothetical protein
VFNAAAFAHPVNESSLFNSIPRRVVGEIWLKDEINEQD